MPKKRFNSQTVILFLITLSLVVIFASLRFFGLTTPVENIARTMLKPIQKISTQTGRWISTSFDTISSIGRIKRENQDLTKQVQELKVKISQDNELSEENKFLREQLALAAATNWDLKNALVIGSDPNRLSQYLIIDQGEKNEIQIEMPVLSASGILVGRINSVFSTSSQVLLITDPSSKVNAILQKSRASGIVQGEHGLGLTMNSISQDIFVEKGEAVVTSAIGNIFPPGILIGEVAEVESADNQLFQQARLIQNLDLRNLERVMVLTNFNK
ncbi:MAG: hypothetical protein ACD_68C00108G0003 [uncultured bacterium]|nr:MAG: hypothetical protein ACD_68C00108G0003 [uncultured bacterium]